MLRTVIVDDELKNIRILRELLQSYCPQVTVAGEANGFNEAIEMIQTLQPDLLLLDIEMPYGSAFDLLEKLMPVQCDIIFVTAFDNYALKAFKYNALDYLVKPVNIDELKAAIAKAEEKSQQKNINLQLTNLISNFKNTEAQKIALPLIDGLIFVSVKEIIYLRARGSCTEIHMQNGKTFTTGRVIKYFEDLLAAGNFYRVHNSYLISVNHIKRYHKGRGGVLEMEDGAMIEVSVRKRDEFLSRFGI